MQQQQVKLIMVILQYFTFLPPDRCCYLDVVVGLAYRDEATELYWLEQPFIKVIPCQTGRLKS
ncbi:unnamed protein product, partial [Schistosoma mattheei]